MPRDISAGLQAHLEGKHLTLALCVRVERVDGTVLGFTSNNKNVTFEGEVYEANAAVNASDIKSSEGTGVDNMDITGIVNSDRIASEDLRAGLYDDARVEVFIVNYKNIAQGRLILLKGTIGRIRYTNGAFYAEVRSLLQRLSQQIVELTTPTCRVKRLFDQRCNGDGNVDITQFINTRTVTGVNSLVELEFGSDTEDDDFYSYGEVEMRSGANRGISREVKMHTNSGSTATITLQLPFPFEVQVGDVAVLYAGCDRTFETCVTKFDNAINFRGEPHIPGNDQLLKQGRR